MFFVLQLAAASLHVWGAKKLWKGSLVGLHLPLHQKQFSGFCPLNFSVQNLGNQLYLKNTLTLSSFRVAVRQEEFTKCFGFLWCRRNFQPGVGRKHQYLCLLQFGSCRRLACWKSCCRGGCLQTGSCSLSQGNLVLWPKWVQISPILYRSGNAGWSFLIVLVRSFVADYCYQLASVKPQEADTVSKIRTFW